MLENEEDQWSLQALLLVPSSMRSTFTSLEPPDATVFSSLLQILIHVGFLTEESGDVFSPKVLKGGPLGEMVQWADILTALHVLGHNLKISMSVKELQGWVESYAEGDTEDVCRNGVTRGLTSPEPEPVFFLKASEVVGLWIGRVLRTITKNQKKTYSSFSAVAHARVYAPLSFTIKIHCKVPVKPISISLRGYISYPLPHLSFSS